MVLQWETLHRYMLADIEKCWHLAIPGKEQVDAAFKIALDYWEDLKQDLAQHVFPDTAGEIHFYKNVKPLFTCYIEYLALLYLAFCFLPHGDREIQNSFWTSEAKKLQKFKDRNAAFVTYYKSGNTGHDLQYFLPDNYDLCRVTVSKVYDMDGRFKTSHDHLVATLLAHELYHEYVMRKLG